MPLLLIAYDISDNRRRTRVAKALLRFGPRVQRSVFLARRGSAAEIAKLLRPLLDPGDDVRIQPLCATCAERAIVLGHGRSAEPLLGFKVV